jgi:esterase/lipase superfamily enzyme
LFDDARTIRALPSPAHRHVGFSGVLGLALVSAGCGTANHPYRLEMMPPPAIYATGVVTSPDERHPELRDGLVSLPYVTQREPAAPEHDEPFYRNTRGSVLRLGIAVVSATVDEKARRREMGSEDVAPIMLEVTGAQELGVLPATWAPFAAADFAQSAAESGPREFATAVDRTLLDGPGRDVYIYVHGYKVVFENAVAVSTELWHYLDYEGAFIAFAWPARPRRMAYLGDLETAEVAAIVLRHFVRYLASDTHARRVHIVGYSAGTRVSAGFRARPARTGRLDRQRHGPRAAGPATLGWDPRPRRRLHRLRLIQGQGARYGAPTLRTGSRR